MKTKRRNSESVSPVIATILMVAITVVLAAVLYVLVSTFLQGPGQTQNIAVVCMKAGTSNAKCNIASSDTGVDFTQVGIQVKTSGGDIVGTWAAGISFTSGYRVNDTASSPVLSGRLVDNGDNAFGIGDDIYLTPEPNLSLSGLSVKLSGGNAQGEATIP
jgi:flagellin-like protein